MSSILGGFQDASQVAQVADLFRWLDIADGAEAVQAVKARMLEVRTPQIGEKILDVGCGVGHEVRRLLPLVGSSGRVVGVDKNAAMVAEAQRRDSGESAHAEFVVGDAGHLEFAADLFDLCRAERVLRYVDTPEQALREMVRVVRPGGSVVVFDFDSDQTIVDAPDHALVRRVAEVLDAAVPNPWIGRQLRRLFRQAGLADVAVSAQVVIMTSPHFFPLYRRLVTGSLEKAVETHQIPAADVARWWTLLEQADAEGHFFSATPGFIVSGQKPGRV